MLRGNGITGLAQASTAALDKLARELPFVDPRLLGLIGFGDVCQEYADARERNKPNE
jgi:hypothetical protein